MTFLSPALLLLGAVVAVPLILHLFHRQQGPRVVFPAVRYLRRAEREHATRIRLRQLLLLALRALGILLLAGAAARPFLRGAGGAHEPTAVAIVLDNSMSSGAVVGDRRALDHLEAAARATLDAAGPDDRFWLIRAGEPWQPAIAGDADRVAEAVQATAPASGGADLLEAVARADAILAGSDLRAREIHVLSDLQATGFAGAGTAVRSVVRVLAPEPGAPMNRAVTAVDVGGGLPPRADERSTVSATLGGSRAEARPGDADPRVDSVGVRLVLDGSVRAATTAPADAAVVLPFPARPPGTVTGAVEIDRDALAADDRRVFVVDVIAPPAVALADASPFLAEALAVLAEAGRVRRAEPGAADVVVAPGARGTDASLRGAAVVVVPPASPLEVAAANRSLAAAGIPWRLTAPVGGEARLDTAGLALASVLADARLRQVYGLVPADGPGASLPGADSVRVRLRSGEPWIVTGRAGNGAAGRYVLLGTPLTAEAGTLPTSAAMLPLLDRAVNVWAAGTAPGVELVPGDVIELPAGDSVVRPDGTAAPVPVGVYRLAEAGLHRVYSAGALAAAYAVNPPAAESDLTPLTAGAAARRIPATDVRVAAGDAWPSVIYHRRLGRDVTLPLVLVGLAVLLLESALAASGRKG